MYLHELCVYTLFRYYADHRTIDKRHFSTHRRRRLTKISLVNETAQQYA